MRAPKCETARDQISPAKPQFITCWWESNHRNDHDYNDDDNHEHEHDYDGDAGDDDDDGGGDGDDDGVGGVLDKVKD